MAIVNYINSPSFETSAWGSIDGQVWDTWGWSGSSTIQRSTTVKSIGTYGLRIEIYDGTAGAALLVPLPDTATPKTWTFSYNVTMGGSLYHPFCEIDAVDGTTLAFTGNFTSGTRQSLQFTQQPGVTSITIYFGADNLGSGQNKTIGIDALRLCEGTASNYVDGNTSGYVWAGTPHASQTIDAPSVTYNGVWNYWTQPKTNSVAWAPYWESSSQTSAGMTVTNGPNGVTVSGTVSRSSSSNYKDIGLDSGNNGAWAIPLDNLPAGTAYLSLTVTSITGAGANDVIRTKLRFWDSGKAFISDSTGSLPITGGRAGGPVIVPSGAAYASLYVTISTPSGFTSSAHTVTASFNNIRLSTQNETTYVDGDTAGYGWKGTPNNSVTIAALTAQASASGSSTGSLETRTYSLAQSTAYGSSIGSLDVWLIGTELHAAGSSTGSLELWPYGPASLSGTGISTGSLRADTLLFFELSGTASSAGFLGADIAIFTFAGAFGSSTGAIAFSVPDELNPAGPIAGIGSSTGSIEMAIAGVTSASGEGISIGLLDIGDYIPAGAFADFAIFGIGETDPLKSITANSNGGTRTGATGEEWVRVYGEFVVPGDQPTSDGMLWRRAAYVVPGIKFDSVPAGAWQEFTQFQVEIAGPDGPTPFQPGASLRPMVYADRANLSPHTIDVLANPGPSYAADDIDSPIPGDPTGALRVTLKFGHELFVRTTLEWLRPNTRYTVSLYANIYGSIADLGINVVDADTMEELSGQMFYSQVGDEPDMAGWRRLHVSFVAPENGRAKLIYSPRIWAQTQDEVFDVAGLLVEEGPEVLPYFWPDTTSQDTIYRNGYSDATGGIFHYRDRERRTYILKKALTDHVPTGIGIGEPEFGTIPHIDV